MNILVVTDLYPIKDNEKYTPQTIKNFVKEWQKQNHNVKIIKPNFILNSIIRHKPFYKNGIYNDIENINYWLPFCGNVKDKIKTNIDLAEIIIAHMPSGIIFANKLNKPFCAAVHSSDIEVLTNPLYKYYFKRELENGYNNAIKIACRSYALKNKFLALYPQHTEKTFVAPSGIDFKPVHRTWTTSNKIKVLTCGQFIKRKNIDKVISLCDKYPNIELTVIGSGKLEHKLKSISNKPKFTGQLSHSEVLKEMQSSDIFILPSVNETFGMVYLEAMASGCVTICTKNDGVDGIIINDINGYTTNPNNLEETLDKILSKNNQTILDNAYNLMLNYTQEKTAISYLNNIFSN